MKRVIYTKIRRINHIKKESHTNQINPVTDTDRHKKTEKTINKITTPAGNATTYRPRLPLVRKLVPIHTTHKDQQDNEETKLTTDLGAR